ncbi:hypothetical protein NPIL_16361 [Nephila pilipes]|uniref:Uncharacterized protein n=1 Tax=Nephila pilipes TaxID=299642 RepID=A0A8X6IDJ6_NEPPI|nr:hypothetical protein NPIL_16361 [Nephila pilipes]
MQHEDAYSHVCHIESRYMDRESDFYKGAYGFYLTAKEAAEEAEANAHRTVEGLRLDVESCVQRRIELKANGVDFGREGPSTTLTLGALSEACPPNPTRPSRATREQPLPSALAFRHSVLRLVATCFRWSTGL